MAVVQESAASKPARLKMVSRGKMLPGGQAEGANAPGGGGDRMEKNPFGGRQRRKNIFRGWEKQPTAVCR